MADETTTETTTEVPVEETTTTTTVEPNTDETQAAPYIPSGDDVGYEPVNTEVAEPENSPVLGEGVSSDALEAREQAIAQGKSDALTNHNEAQAS
jgi:hypothetical protein